MAYTPLLWKSGSNQSTDVINPDLHCRTRTILHIMAVLLSYFVFWVLVYPKSKARAPHEEVSVQSIGGFGSYNRQMDEHCWYSSEGKPPNWQAASAIVVMFYMVWYGGASKRCATIQPILSSRRGAQVCNSYKLQARPKCVTATSIYARFNHCLISPHLIQPAAAGSGLIK